MYPRTKGSNDIKNKKVAASVLQQNTPTLVCGSGPSQTQDFAAKFKFHLLSYYKNQKFGWGWEDTHDGDSKDKDGGQSLNTMVMIWL